MVNQSGELSDDRDHIEEDLTMHSWLRINEVYAVRRNLLIAATLELEKRAREAGILEEEDY